MLQCLNAVEQIPLGGQVALSQHLLYLLLQLLPDTQTRDEGVPAGLAELDGTAAAAGARGGFHQRLFLQRVQIADDGGAVQAAGCC